MKLYIDEAWRWPLAWPLHVGIILPLKRFNKKKFKDSKKLTQKQRNKLFQDIKSLQKKWALIYSTGIVNNQEIDFLWLSKAINLAIKRGVFDILKDYYQNFLKFSLSKWLCSCDILNKFAIENILQKTSNDFSTEDLIELISIIAQTNPIDEIVIDWNHKFWLDKDLKIKIKTVIKWDDKIPSISMASIIAKVTRDNRMIEFADHKYPQYNFKQHKWYGTKEHIHLIIEKWQCDIHRNLFLRKINI